MTEETKERVKKLDEMIQDYNVMSNQEPFKAFDYSKQKKAWVHHQTGSKSKIKLRQYIAKQAKMISKISDKSFTELRKILVDKYNENGLIGIKIYYLESLKQSLIDLDA